MSSRNPSQVAGTRRSSRIPVSKDKPAVKVVAPAGGGDTKQLEAGQAVPARKKSTKSNNTSLKENSKPVEVAAGKKSAKGSEAAEETRRHLSVVDANRHGSRTSAGDLDDSVFADTKSRLGSLASSVTKHRRSLSRSRPDDSPDPTGAFRPRRASPTADTGPLSVADIPALPAGVLDLDLEEDGWSEYGAEMDTYLKDRETKFVLEADYLEQSSVTAEMRATLVDWLTQVQHYLKLEQQTHYIGISLLDTILALRDVEPEKLQLVGIAALYIASKMEEYYPADLKKLVHLTENSYKVSDVFDMELVILGVVDFELYVPTPADYLPRLCRAALRPAPSFLKTCYFLTDAHLPQAKHPTLAPSHLAAAAVLASILLHYKQANPGEGRPTLEDLWTPTLRHYSGYTAAQVLSTVVAMLAAAEQEKLVGARTKYSSRSQHQRLTAAPHLAKEVLAEARRAAGLMTED